MRAGSPKDFRHRLPRAPLNRLLRSVDERCMQLPQRRRSRGKGAVALVLLAVLAAGGAFAAWHHQYGRHRLKLGMSAEELRMPAFIARRASVGERRDVRATGLILRHRVLHLHEVARPTSMSSLPAGSTLIYSGAEELDARVNAVLDGVIPVERGLEAMFAVGRLAPARLVRLDAEGRVESIEDVRVTFVAFTVP